MVWKGWALDSWRVSVLRQQTLYLAHANLASVFAKGNREGKDFISNLPGLT